MKQDMTKLRAVEDTKYRGVPIRKGEVIGVNMVELARCKVCKATREWLLRVFRELKQ